MTIILTTTAGTTQVSHTNNVVAAIAFAESYGHECTGEYKESTDEVTFSWDFEDCGSEGIIKHISVKVDGVDCADDDFIEAGTSIPDARRAAKKLAKKLDAEFRETTIKGTANDYRSALATNNNENR